VLVYLIEPQALFSSHLERVLVAAGLPAATVRREVDAAELIVLAPDVVFVDLDFFAEGGPTALCRIRDAVRGATIVGYTHSLDPLFAASCFIAGASALIEKSADERRTVDEIKGVFREILTAAS